VSPSRKRDAVDHLEGSFEVSERRACAVLDQPRSTQRYERKPASDESSLVARMHELVRRHPRFGYRRIAALLRREGFRAGFDRVYRLWRREGLKVPKSRRKRRRLGTSANGCVRRRVRRPNEVWAWDFIFDRTTSGTSLKWLSVIDEFTRECLCLKVARRMTNGDIIEVLGGLFLAHGMPAHIRSDNGPEFIAKGLREWLERSCVGPLYIEPGSPWENGYAESFHSKLRDEFLGCEEFESLREATMLGASWRRAYNEVRPHSSLGYVPPAEFARACGPSAPASAAPQPALQAHTLTLQP
jgi:transposase InsO family protein